MLEGGEGRERWRANAPQQAQRPLNLIEKITAQAQDAHQSSQQLLQGGGKVQGRLHATRLQ